jgi:hypothetical protein
MTESPLCFFPICYSVHIRLRLNAAIIRLAISAPQMELRRDFIIVHRFVTSPESDDSAKAGI